MTRPAPVAPWWAHPFAQYAALAALAAALVIGLDVVTNSLAIDRYAWDFVHYIDMAENGISGNPGLVAPYAYRPIPSLLAGAFSEVTGRSTVLGFRLIAWAGVWAELVLAFALARQFTRRFWGALAVMLIVGVSTFNARFYVFDPFRPDPLAFPLLLLGLIGLVRRRGNRGWDAVIIGTAIVGAGIREFALIPAVLLAARLLVDGTRKRRWQDFAELALVVAVILLALALPRALVQVVRADSYLDRIDGGLLGAVTDWRRNLNIVFALLITFLPVFVVLTAARARRLWSVLRPLRLELGLYAAVVVALTLVGGSDLPRFTAYLVGMVVIALAVLIEDGLRPLEILYALFATALFHRPLTPIPMESVEAYQDWHVTFYQTINAYTLARMGEWLLWVLGGVGLRWASRR
jgi:MYXO-CTERM domain-containing protein